MTDRSWIWLGIGAAGTVGLGLIVNAIAVRFQEPWLLNCGWIVFGVAILLVVASVRELWMDHAQWRQEMWARKQHALSETPAVRIAEALRGLHPAAAQVVNKFGVRTQWQVKIEADRSRDWILLGTNVHFGFVEFVLSHSNESSLYPKRMFSEGSRKWDPDGLTEDREQYAELESWMQSRLMVTRSFGDNQAPHFIPPWTPALVLEVMGLDGPQDLYQPESPSPLPSASPQMEKRNLGGEGKQIEVKVPELTDDEQAETRRLQDEHEKNTKMSKDAYAKLPKDPMGHAVVGK